MSIITKDMVASIHTGVIVAQLQQMALSDDREMAHVDADDVLCDILEALGLDEIVEAYRAIPKWYARQ